ncbi:MAG: pyruvate kinase [Bacteroidales bacterium]|nr:pyruvate kinase [Bacteroidales bacterium]
MTFDNSKTKIIATLGPASSDKETLRKMFEAGVDVCRVNFSHSKHEKAAEIIKTIREINAETGMDVAILADLQGPKLRVGEMKNGKVFLERGKILDFVTDECIGTAEKVYMSYQEFPEDVEPGDAILIDDGKIKLEVTETNGKNSVKAKVIHSGLLSSNKGVNLPNTNVSLPSLTEKDIADANFALDQDVDWLALSFVRAVSDVIELKQLIKRKRKKTYVVSKIEKPQAIKNIDAIIEETDAIMVARGDLGVEMPFDCVPLLQKEIVEKCINASVPVIIATQMMESMITNFRPTRAEANDVANAVIDGVDTVMLSGETSIGKYPVETIKNMHKIIQYTEKHRYNYNRGVPPKFDSPRFLRDNVCYSASIMAERVGAKAIITFTEKGSTASTISGYRPKADIFAFTRHKDLLCALSLLWGVRALYFDEVDNVDEAIKLSIDILKEKGLLSIGDYVIHVASTPMNISHKTNMLKVTKVN